MDQEKLIEKIKEYEKKEVFIDLLQEEFGDDVLLVDCAGSLPHSSYIYAVRINIHTGELDTHRYEQNTWHLSDQDYIDLYTTKPVDASWQQKLDGWDRYDKIDFGESEENVEDQLEKLGEDPNEFTQDYIRYLRDGACEYQKID